MKINNISIANDFSKVPAGRYVKDGNLSGEVFRESLLMPMLASADTLIVNLDGTEGYGSSFLEEAFGGLIRRGVSEDELAAKLRLVSEEDPTLSEEILGYIRDASLRMKAGK